MTSDKSPFTIIKGDMDIQTSTQLPVPPHDSSPHESDDGHSTQTAKQQPGHPVTWQDRPDGAPAPVAVNDEQVLREIAQLELEHRDLDTAIASIEERVPYDRLSLMRLKKKKLAIKDEIAKRKNSIEPDIIA